METKEELNTKVVTGKNEPLIRFSYVNVIDPKPDKDGKITYELSLIIPKDSTDNINAIKKAVSDTIIRDGARFNGKDPYKIKKFHWPLKDGDEDYPDNPEYANSYYVKAKSPKPVTVIDQTGKQLTSRSEFYSGCYGRASIMFYGYNNESTGVTCRLYYLQKLKDGEPLGGVSSIEDDFADSIESLSDFL